MSTSPCSTLKGEGMNTTPPMSSANLSSGIASQRRRKSSRVKWSPATSGSISCITVAIICSFCAAILPDSHWFCLLRPVFASESLVCWMASLPDPIKFRLGSTNQSVAREGGRGQRHLAQAVFAEQLELRPGLDDVGVAVFTQEKVLVRGGPGRGSIGIGARPNALALVNLLTGTGVVTIKRAHILENVQAISVHDKARVVRSRRLLPPGDVLIAG